MKDADWDLVYRVHVEAPTRSPVQPGR